MLLVSYPLLSGYCLNPYYTGIHLHNWRNRFLEQTQSRLNPYYTGIHLHITSICSLTERQCLNPYYTGIHLHSNCQI